MENPFTDRQMEILKLLTKGLTMKQIAEKLGIKLKTVATHKARIYMELRKYGVKNREELIKYVNLKSFLSSNGN